MAGVPGGEAIDATERRRGLPMAGAPRAARRIAIAVAICAVVSSQVLFQPRWYAPFDPGPLALAWLDYFGECLLMGLPIAAGLTLAERLAAGRSRGAGVVLALAGLATGSTLGALLLLPYYDLGAEALDSNRFAGDILYWAAIGGGAAWIHALQRRAADADAVLHRARVAREALDRRLLEARLQVLRAQIEPHFLFNTLATVRRLGGADAAGAITMLADLERYLAASLPRLRDDDSTLAQEVELVRAYLALLRVRMGDRLAYRITLPDELAGHPFPPMMLLTLVENAIKHGLASLPAGGSVEIDASRRGGRLDVRVADDGAGFARSATGGAGVGLANTRERLAALYGSRAELVLEGNAPSGVVASIRLPWRSAAEAGA